MCCVCGLYVVCVWFVCGLVFSFACDVVCDVVCDVLYGLALLVATARRWRQCETNERYWCCKIVLQRTVLCGSYDRFQATTLFTAVYIYCGVFTAMCILSVHVCCLYLLFVV